MADKVRVTVHLNGDTSGAGGSLLVFPSSNYDLSALFRDAAKKLGSSKPFTRVFVSSGAEATTIEEVEAGDELYFSSGEEFAGDTSDSKISADVDNNVERNHFLANIASNVVGMASNMYEKGSTFVKDKSPSFVRVTLEKVEDVATGVGNKATPLISSVVDVGTWADTKIDHAYAFLQYRRTEFLSSPMAGTVNDNLVVPMNKRILEPSANFYRTSMEKFGQLAEEAKSRGQEGKVSFESFLAGLKERFGKEWNDRLVSPAKSFHDAATKNAQSAREQLGKAWRQNVVANLPTKIVEPAETFYGTAVAAYTNLAASASNGQVSAQEFMVGMRAQLGQLWNQKLVAPAQHLYEVFNNRVNEKKSEEEASKAEAAEPKAPATKEE